ncbi:uncharacterized protein I303_101041 [Kwoniella dejecticola CBS 10117]|uniref:FAD/NAD(P)-binding domain-containing protein n=1 Tax=Kwoniella dejecticola CBS 10117 TaxID=1296121 RepID=A0AAJ8KIS7_9TREE
MAGHTLANELVPNLQGDYRILLIDALDYSFWPIAALRAAVVPGWEEKIVLPLNTATVFPEGSIHQVIAPNKVVQLRPNSVILENPFEGSKEVPFFRAVLATGSIQPSPMRPSYDWTKEDYMQGLRKSQDELKRAKSVIIVGGGTVGVEFAGEVRALYPEKEITIVHNKSTVLSPDPLPISYISDGNGSLNTKEKIPNSWTSPPTHPKLSRYLMSYLEAGRIHLVLEDRLVIPDPDARNADSNDWDGSFGLQPTIKKLRTEKGQKIKGDYIFLAAGNKPNSSLVRNVDQDAVDKNGLIKVDNTLHVDSFVLGNENYYAIGDVNDAPGTKTAYLATVQAKSAATNLINEIQGKRLAPYNPGTFSGLFVPFGPDLGAGSITLPSLGTWTVGTTVVRKAKGQKLLLDRWGDAWMGKEKVTIIP